jgi:hypothetical protein
MQITLHLDPSATEYTRALQVTLHVESDPALDIHEKPQNEEPTAADLMALAQWLLAYLSPSLAEGKLRVSGADCALIRPPRFTSIFRHAGEGRSPILPAALTPPATLLADHHNTH